MKKTAKLDKNEIRKRRQEIFAKVARIVRRKLRIKEEEIEQYKMFKDLGADSLQQVEIIMMTEEEFRINIPYESFPNIYKVGLLVDAVIALHGK